MDAAKVVAAIDSLLGFIQSLPAKPTGRTRAITETQLAEFRQLDGRLAGLAAGASTGILRCTLPIVRESHQASSPFAPGQVWTVPPQREAELMGYSQLHVSFAGSLAAVGDYIERLDGFKAALESPVENEQPPVVARVTRPNAAEYDRLCDAFLKSECAAGRKPGPTAVKKQLKCGVKTVYQLPSFAAYWKEIKKGRKPKVVSFTKGMEAVTSKNDGELARLMREQRRDDTSNKVKSRDRA